MAIYGPVRGDRCDCMGSHVIYARQKLRVCWTEEEANGCAARRLVRVVLQMWSIDDILRPSQPPGLTPPPSPLTSRSNVSGLPGSTPRRKYRSQFRFHPYSLGAQTENVEPPWLTLFPDKRRTTARRRPAYSERGLLPEASHRRCSG
jgi:hypothetical protein